MLFRLALINSGKIILYFISFCVIFGYNFARFGRRSFENELLALARFWDEKGLRSSSGSKLRLADAIRTDELNPFGSSCGFKYSSFLKIKKKSIQNGKMKRKKSLW